MAQNPFDQFDGDNPFDRFDNTAGGAAVGNPNLRRQGERRQNQKTSSEALATIGGAGAVGAGLGAVAPELLGTAATVSAGFPPPFNNMRVPLNFMAMMAKQAGRGVGAVAGGISGLASETAGQAVEATGAPQPYAEAARLVAGGVGNEPYQLIKTYVTKPALSFASHVKKQALKAILKKVEGDPELLTAQERKFMDDAVAEIRGGARSDTALGDVGTMMGAEGNRLMADADRQTIAATRQASSVGNPRGIPGESGMADIGEGLQRTILARNEGALKARSEQYTKNQEMRDAIVAQREGAGQYPKDMPEYQNIVQSLEAELTPGTRSPDVAKSFQQILSAIKTKGEPLGALTERQRLGYDPKPTPKETPATFQAIDDVRRQLGEVFRGKPPQGYEGIDAATARKYYAQLSDLQKTYAGGRGGPQERLLEDYASATPGLEVFSSRLGKKVTALDQYREGQYPDPSAIPSAFFKTRASVQALRELTGNQSQVNQAALEFANKELAGKDAAAVRAWRSKNDWLAETPAAQRMVDQYAYRLEQSERSLLSAENFAKEAARDSSLLVGKSLPVQRAIDLMKSGDTELWAKVLPVINKSPQAQGQMAAAARQVVADMATTKAAGDFFSRNLRPFLEQSGASKAELDLVAANLEKIKNMAIPEPQKMGMAKRMMLNAVGGYGSSGASRGAFGIYSGITPNEQIQMQQGQ